MSNEMDMATKVKISSVIRQQCERHFGPLHRDFLCQTVSILNPKTPRCVPAEMKLDKVIRLLADEKIGCILITKPDGTLAGIFSERDLVRKVLAAGLDHKTTSVGEVMTADPVVETADTTVAFVLTIMSQGGFRHIPLVDDQQHPVGIISVKDLVDHLVNSVVSELLGFEEEE